MLHLHLCDPPIIHRDLKSPNLLVDKHWKLKVRHALLGMTCWAVAPVLFSSRVQASGAPHSLLPPPVILDPRQHPHRRCRCATST